MANLVELFDNIVQMQALNGVPLANGKLYVYALGRTRLMDTWSDVDGESLNTNPIILDDAGQAHVYVSDDFDYTLVVCDAYNNEIFSIDKYLYSKGEHSHADVAVAPSEHIAVSSYHVGETTVYVPYIVGELGKTYHGIEPIVVNNQENKISARNIPLGVQEPLFFVEDSESACIIGASGLQPSGNYATVEWVTEHNFMSEDNVQFDENGNITAYNGSAFAGGYVDPSDFIPWSASGNFATSGDLNDKLDTTAFSNVSGDFLTAVPDDYATKDFVSSGLSSKLDSTAFSTVSGNFLTAHQSLEGYATEQWVENKGYITGIDGVLYESGFGYSDGKISGYNGTAFVGEGGGVTGEYELSAGSGISIVNYPLEQKTVISVTAQGGNPEVEQAVIDNSATWNTVSDKLDTTAFSDVSGTFLTAHQDLSDYQTVAGMTAYQAAGNYLTADALDNVSGNWNEVSAKLDTSAFSDVSGTFLTAHQDLSDYQTIAGMTAYQPVGSYLTADALDNVSGDWNEVSAKLDTTAFSDVSGTFLTAHQDISNKLDTTAFSDVSGSFLTAHQSLEGYLQDSDLGISDNKITAISGVELSAGGDVPEGVMVESGIEYNSQGYINGYSGSAIATIDQERMWFTHDDTIVHVSNSAQYAFGVNMSAISADLARMMGVDETVLWSGNLPMTTGSTARCSESIYNFNKIKFLYDASADGEYQHNSNYVVETDQTSATNRISWEDGFTIGNNWYNHYYNRFTVSNGTDLTLTNANCYWGYTATAGNSLTGHAGHFYKIVGIGRKS